MYAWMHREGRKSEEHVFTSVVIHVDPRNIAEGTSYISAGMLLGNTYVLATTFVVLLVLID